MLTKILYEDKHILVIYKPSGIATQSGLISAMDVESELKNYLSKAGGNKREPFLGIVHRLDQPVEGVLIVAKSSQVTALLNRQLQSNQLKKSYVAVVYGKVPTMIQSRVDYLKKDTKLKKALLSAHKSSDYKEAKIQYCGLAHNERHNISWVQIEIETGRFHQIRAQMAHVGHPLLGDLKYADDSVLQLSRNLGMKCVALCANEITFLHPITEKIVTFKVEPENKVFSLFEQKLEGTI